MALSPSSPRGPRLGLRHRFVLALIAVVLVAFAVAAGMALLLPPDQDRAIRLDAVAAALRGTGDATLARTVQAAAPAAGNERWLEIVPVQRQLAALLRADPADVRLMVASPIGLRRIGTALAGGAAIRAGFLPFDQTNETAAPAPPVGAPPAAAVVVTPPIAAAPITAPRPVEVRRPPPAEPARPQPRPPVPVRDGPGAVETRAAAREPIREPDPAVRATPAPVAAPPAPESVPAVPTPAPAPAAASAGPQLVGAVPEIRGMFRAALRLPNGGWAVVQPRAETVPTVAQQRIILWFLVALAITVPLAWAAAIQLVRPLRRFADAAEQGGRDPAAAMPDGLPSELAPAAAALARLHGRIQALSGDRDAFAGTLRNEVRAPLDRLRAGLDDAPRQIREAFHDDVADIDDAVTAMQMFLTDAVAPGALARHDLGELVRAAASAAAARGEPVAADATGLFRVNVDPIAIGRLLEQLIAYARRQGGGVTMIVGGETDRAIVTMAETAKPVIAGFAPGLRGKAERAAGVRPNGTALAIARSIARAHGGEIRLVRSEQGMFAELRLPLA